MAPLLGSERDYVSDVLKHRKFSGEGPYNKKASEFLRKYLDAKFVTLTPSCTAALEMAYVLLDLKPGDEVILPSFTFTSTATATTQFGATPIFVDVDDTLNVDPARVTEAISAKTKAICVVHYAGFSADMDSLKKITADRNIPIIEDAAQGLFALYKNKPLGSLGDLAAFSFHETKNIVCGEGGALVINNPAYLARAEIVRDKGTNRQKFLRGEVDKYTWVDKGSSYLLGELPAAFLFAQLERGEEITQKRRALWEHYFRKLTLLSEKGALRLPQAPEFSQHNGHIFYIILPNPEVTIGLAAFLKEKGISATSHYVPLHSSPAGLSLGRTCGPMTQTESLAYRLLRLPMFFDLELNQIDFICEQIYEFFVSRTANVGA